MKRLKNIVFIILLVNFSVKAQQCPVIPLPNNVQAVTGNFILNNNTPIMFNQQVLQKQANYIQQQLLKNTGLALSIQTATSLPAISLNIDTKIGQQGTPGAYTLSVKSTGIQITAATQQGVFYGITTLLQLARLGTVQNNSVSINCWYIKDEPHYAWRGLLLDESRHFWGKQTVKELLDWMAFYKLNKFHWHLTDEPGWRLEVRSYPMLSLIGGIGTFSDKFAPAQYYTQDDIKEIVAYAAERFIDVIPEVDMPGHASAANKAYPEFSGGGSAAHPDFTFDPGKDTTYTYLGKILKEVDALFPSQMIHLGGDEVSFGNEKWSTNTGISELMKKNNLTNMTDVEHYFTSRMADSLFKLNNKVLLWDEAADSDLPKDKTIIFWWRHDKPGQLMKALDKGYQVVLCPRLPFYFDFVQDASQKVGRRWQGDFVTLDKLYNFTTNSLNFNNQYQQQILGVQAALWTENITTKNKLEYMLFPRITALAEAGWAFDDKKDISAFKARVKAQLMLYKKDGIYYYDPFAPQQTPEPLTARQIADYH